MKSTVLVHEIVEFGARLRKIRRDKGLTQGQLADLVGTDTSSISSAELGIHGFRWPTIVRLARALDCKIDDFAASD